MGRGGGGIVHGELGGGHSAWGVRGGIVNGELGGGA